MIRMDGDHLLEEVARKVEALAQLRRYEYTDTPLRPKGWIDEQYRVQITALLRLFGYNELGTKDRKR